jgi:hypothetical protein
VLKNAEKRNWKELPANVSRYGDTPDQIFTTYHDLEDKYGSKIKDIPFGAIALYTFVEKLRTGLTQFMAGARSFRLDTLRREDVVALTEEAARISGLTYIMDAHQEEAEAILDR